MDDFDDDDIGLAEDCAPEAPGGRNATVLIDDVEALV